MPIRTNRGRAAVYRRLWGWPMRSPRHFMVTLVVIAAAVTVIGLIVPKVAHLAGSPSGGTGATAGPTTTAALAPQGNGAGSRAPSAVPTTPLPTRLPSAPQTPTSAPPAPEALDVATAWSKAWVNHPQGTSTEQWL